MGILIYDQYAAWQQECEARFRKLRANEEQLNRMFIALYGLQGELTPEVEEKDVTVRRADLTREIRSLISYAVGCLFGRYSVDTEGLCYAGGAWDDSLYQTVIPTKTNILPIGETGDFEDDLTVRIIEFVRLVYGEDTLEDNLACIAGALGGTGTPREVLRKYLLTGFYPDHCKIYQKRPIYWMFSSGRKHGFKALVYMHRWRPSTIATVRTDYVQKLQERRRMQLSALSARMQTAAQSDCKSLRKQKERLAAKLDEIDIFEKKLHCLADQNTGIDLDDGVKVSYERFAEVLEKL